MRTAGVVVTFLGYAILSYGIVLIRGYDITPKQWFDPLTPLQSWPAPNSVPAGQIFPGGGGAGAAAAAGNPGSSAGGPLDRSPASGTSTATRIINDISNILNRFGPLR